MKILAFHNYASHDAGAAALVESADGVAHAIHTEERLSRVKYSYFFPARSVHACMRDLEIESLRAFDVIATDYSFEPRLQNTNPRYRKLEADYIKARLDLDYSKVLYVDHHAAHAASAFYPSDFSDAAVLVVDGVGSQGNTNSLYLANRSTGLTLVDKAYGSGIGLLYTIVTRQVLNLGVGQEGKTMGLAAVGEQCQGAAPAVRFDGHYDGLVTDFSATIWRSPASTLRQPLPRCTDAAQLTTPFYASIAHALQLETERCMLHLARYAFERTGARHLCIAGGVGLNCVANERIVNEGPFERVFIQPASSDCGLPLGLALYAFHDERKRTRRVSLQLPFAGRRYETSATETLLRRFGVAFTHGGPQEVARALSEGAIVGWFIENGELGPRALGHRSILADPRRAGMKDLLNAKVKHREMFRPFAPAVLAERAAEYFEMRQESPYMLLAPRVRPERVQEIPAVVHLDGSARVQTVDTRHNPVFYELIAEFAKLTATPIVLNTSFNDNGEPIVETPLDALICFLRTKMDYLYLDGLLIERTAVVSETAILQRLLEERTERLQHEYRAAIDAICRGYSAGELKAFLKAYHPMHAHFARLHTLTQLQNALSEWQDGDIVIDAYHLEIIERFLPEEHTRHGRRFVMVEDVIESVGAIKDGSLVVLFNMSLYLDGSAVTNFYADRSMALLQPLYVDPVPDEAMTLSNEYLSSADWDAFYRRLFTQPE